MSHHSPRRPRVRPAINGETGDQASPLDLFCDCPSQEPAYSSVWSVAKRPVVRLTRWMPEQARHRTPT
jgi:hypothetical protein